MHSTPEHQALAELPYGTRQRIVVVPDDILDAENQPTGAPDPPHSRRPWDALRGDPQHPILKEAEDDGLRLLPVQQSHVGQLEMPFGHPLPDVVYIGSPAVAQRYYPIADFHVRVFEERFGEAMRLLMALGRRTGQGPVRARLEAGHQREHRGADDARPREPGRPAHRQSPRPLTRLRRRAGPSCEARGAARTRLVQPRADMAGRCGGTRKVRATRVQLHLTSREDFRIDADVVSKIGRRKVLRLGGGFNQHVNTSCVLEGTFGEPPKRGWKRNG